MTIRHRTSPPVTRPARPRTSSRTRVGRAAATAVLLFLASCSDSGEGGAGGGDTQAGSDAGCVSPGTAPARIAAGLRPDSGAQLIGKSAAVPSHDFPGVFLIAAAYAQGTSDNQVGVWATTDLATGTIMAVGEPAVGISNLPVATSGDREITSSAEGYVEAVTCVRRNLAG